MIAFENVSFGYGRGTDILRGFSMELKDGGRLCLFGKSGCGKSTILRLAMGLSRPRSGKITGTEGISYSAVFQEDRLIPWKTVLGNVVLFTDGEGTDVNRAKSLLTELGLGEVMDSLPEELSGGMKRRAALARALAHPFDILILDEPFTGLDEAAKRNAIELVNRETEGKMLLLATHDLQEAEALGADVLNL